MSAPNFSSQAAQSYQYPQITFGKREQQLFVSIKAYVDSLSPDTVITTQGDIIVGDASGNAVRLGKGSSGLPLVSGASTVSYSAIAAAGLASGAVTLAKLAAGVTPSHIVKFAAQYTTLGGAAAEAITVTGVAATDFVFVQVKSQGLTPRTVLASAATLNTVTVTFSGDPSTDHVIYYEVLRAAS